MSTVTDGLRVLVGDENTDKIIEMYVGDYIYIPKAPIDNTERNTHILKLRERKITIRVIAEIFDVSERTVYKILNKVAPPCEEE